MVVACRATEQTLPARNANRLSVRHPFGSGLVAQVAAADAHLVAEALGSDGAADLDFGAQHEALGRNLDERSLRVRPSPADTRNVTAITETSSQPSHRTWLSGTDRAGASRGTE